MIFTLDPGVKCAGCALFEDDGELTYAWLVEGKDWVSTANEVVRTFPVNACVVGEFVFEHMQVYKETSPGIADDLILLSLMAGRVSGMLSTWVRKVTSYTPATWKGQIPKKIMIERIKKSLSSEEFLRVETPRAQSKAHNVFDAVGIGLFHLRKKRRGAGKDRD